jgi:chromosome segregation protein
MLKLDRLELSGFKSFVDPVALRFAGGVTGIVGPNGCGKSNLADAICWVLGEQSAKSMRGETMEDVIFNGSEQRKPLGLGEVTVSFLAPPGFPGAEDGRIAIARRVFRTGESQYRLNGRLARLKDVKDLLMDTGLGVRAYSVIEQGKIGLILSGKPQERRKLIEEAAGITRYKARKKIAELKLEEAGANLLRLDDIISEVERNLRSLKRQAGAARRFQERRAELARLEREVRLGRWAELARDLAARRGELVAVQAEDAERAAAVHRAEADLAARRERVERAAAALAEKVKRQADLAATIEGRQEFLAGARRTIAEIDARLAAGAARAERLEAERASAALAGAALDGERARLLAEHDGAARAVTADGEALRAAEARAAAAETRLEELRHELLASLGQLDELRRRQHREQLEGEKEAYRERHLGDELRGRAHEIGEVRAAFDEASAAAERLAHEQAALDAALGEARAALERALAAEAEAGEELRALEHERTATALRRQLLADLAATDGDRGAALAERLAAAGLGDALRLRDRVRALEGWEATLDRFLGPVLDAVLVPAGREPLALARELEKSGGVLLAPLDPPAPEAAVRPHDAGVVAALGDALGLEPRLAAALPPAFLVASAADAERLARRHPGVAFLARPALWAQGGLLHLEGAEGEPGYLERTAELARLDAALPALGRALDARRAALATLVGERAARAESIRQLESAAGRTGQEAAGARARREELAARLLRLDDGAAALRREREHASTELERRARARSELGAELARLEAVHAERERRFDAVQAESEAARRERETQRALAAGRRGRLELLAERLRAHDAETARWAAARADADRQLDAWHADAGALAGRRAELTAAMAAAEAELQGALELRAGGDELVRAEAERLDAERQAVRAADAALAELRARHAAARGAVEEARVVLAGLEHDASHLAAEIAERCGEPAPEAPGEPPANLEERAAELARLEQQLEALGPVNVLAAEEYASEEERHAFLAAQRADVARSVESLRATIREINQTSSERFRATIAQVNEQFAKSFVELFRGGEAEMRLMDEDDLLECGIEIVARPPGKRLQNLMLLSGGEKALTAIALLFALFRIKPSPFCILDEVDAPLDDVNTLRFVGMLRELARETQCVVITHNKLTMEVAATLYGVTMEERGVSKLIEVELEEVQPVAATA